MVVDHWHRSSFISPFSHLVVMLSAGASVPASCHVPFVQLIVMLSAGFSSSASYQAPCPLTPHLHLPLVCQLVVASSLLSCCSLLLFSWHAASALQCAASTLLHAATSCPLLRLVASCLQAGCHVASHCAAFISHHLLLRRRLMCPSSTPRLHLHWLVLVSHLVMLPLRVIPGLLPPMPPLQHRLHCHPWWTASAGKGNDWGLPRFVRTGLRTAGPLARAAGVTPLASKTRVPLLPSLSGSPL